MEDFVLPLREAVAKGMITEEKIDLRVADVLRVKFTLGLFDHPYRDPKAAATIVHSRAHEATTLEAARKSLVLLKNENQALPLDPDSVKTVLVAGPGADDPRPMISRYGPMTSDVITPYAGIAKLLGDRIRVIYARGCDWKDSGFPGSDILPGPPTGREREILDEAIAKASEADAIVVVVGDDDSTVGEAHSRRSLDLPGHQTLLVQETVKTGKPFIVVLMSGRAASINWIDKHVDAILACWHGGEKVGQSVAEAIFSENNPGGQLPITFPQTVGQIPLAVPHRNGAWGGQGKVNDPNGWGNTRILTPFYYFGHGLSYTTFKYSDLKIEPENPAAGDKIKGTCNISNMGDRAGDEVVQLYLSDVLATVTPFEQALRGFERISLQPGETKTVRFTLDTSDLEMLNRDNKWAVEPGEFRVNVGCSSAPDGIRLRGAFTVQ
jgi:beta-glucosidase